MWWNTNRANSVLRSKFQDFQISGRDEYPSQTSNARLVVNHKLALRNVEGSLLLKYFFIYSPGLLTKSYSYCRDKILKEWLHYFPKKNGKGGTKINQRDHGANNCYSLPSFCSGKREPTRCFPSMPNVLEQDF